MPIGLQARVVAQSIVRHGFDMKRVVSELRPDIKCRGPYGAKLLDDPVVRREIEVIMNRTERNATQFVKQMWDWLESTDDSREANERRQTAARILAKGYIRDKGPEEKPSKPMVIEGLDSISNLVEPQTKRKDVM